LARPPRRGGAAGDSFGSARDRFSAVGTVAAMVEDGADWRACAAGNLPQTQPQQVLDELFVPIASQLRLHTVAALGQTSRAAVERFREELSRRDVLSKTLYVWGASSQWDLLFGIAPGFDWMRQTWTALPPMKEARTGAVCAMIGRGIYVCGGTRRGLPTNSVEKLCLQRGKWESLPPLLGRRRVDAEGSAAAVLNGQLYICGGLSLCGTIASACVDRFDPEEYVWETLPPMPSRRCRAAAAVAEGVLYICGGSDGNGDRGPMNSVIRFDKEKNCWDSVPSMIERRCGPLAVVANKTIYVGHGERREFVEASAPGSPMTLTAGERFNTETCRWSRCPPSLLSAPGSSAAATVGGFLFVCGGSAQGPRSGGPTSRIVGAELALGSGAAVASWLVPTAMAASSASSATAAGVSAGPPAAARAATVRVLRRNWTT